MRESDNPQVKLVHLIRRSQGLSPQRFQQVWLDVGIGNIAALPGLVRYGQNHALLRGYARGELLFDGFEEYWFADEASFAEATASAHWAALRAHSSGFADPSASLMATVRISLQKDGVPPVDAIRSTEFVNRRPDMPITDFSHYWIEKHGPLAQQIPQIIRYEQNHLDFREYVGGEPRFDGWAATWFTSTAAMRYAAQEPVYADTRADESNFLAGPLPVLFTKERLIFLSA